MISTLTSVLMPEMGRCKLRLVPDFIIRRNTSSLHSCFRNRRHYTRPVPLGVGSEIVNQSNTIGSISLWSVFRDDLYWLPGQSSLGLRLSLWPFSAIDINRDEHRLWRSTGAVY